MEDDLKIFSLVVYWVCNESFQSNHNRFSSLVYSLEKQTMKIYTYIWYKNCMTAWILWFVLSLLELVLYNGNRMVSCWFCVILEKIPQESLIPVQKLRAAYITYPKKLIISWIITQAIPSFFWYTVLVDYTIWFFFFPETDPKKVSQDHLYIFEWKYQLSSSWSMTV